MSNSILDLTTNQPIPGELGHVLIKLADDPWSLTTTERQELRTAFASAQAAWQPRLARLIEPPPIDDAFPAFLLGTGPFAHLAAGVGDATAAAQLSTATADELQRFVDRYRQYLVADDQPLG